MEKFKEAVESQTFALGCLDTHPSYCTTPLYFFYKNGNIDGQFMPPNLLKDSFFEALRVFPILAGCLHMKNGGIDASINVDRNNINMPVYGEYDSDIHFDKIEAANFSWDALPKEISKPGFVLRKGKDNIIKLAEIEIARLQDNSGLVILVNIAHVVMDVNGIVKFLHYWAQLCRQMSLGNLDAKFAEQSSALLHSREHLYNCLPEQTQQLDYATNITHSKKSIISTSFAQLSPETRGKVIGIMTSFFPAESHMFRLPFQNLVAVKEAISSASAEKSCHISDNDIITALLCMVVIQSNNGHSPMQTRDLVPSSRFKRSSNTEFEDSIDNHRLVTIAVDCRYRLENPNMTMYTGNGIISHVLAFPLRDICAEIEPASLATCAMQVRQGVDRISPQYIREFIRLGDSAPDSFQRLMAYMIHVPTRFCVSSQARIDYYGVDFGNGPPVWVSPPKTYVPGYSSILPAPASCKDFYIYLSVKNNVMTRVLSHPFWNDMTELVY